MPCLEAVKHSVTIPQAIQSIRVVNVATLGVSLHTPFVHSPQAVISNGLRSSLLDHELSRHQLSRDGVRVADTGDYAASGESSGAMLAPTGAAKLRPKLAARLPRFVVSLMAASEVNTGTRGAAYCMTVAKPSAILMMELAMP